MTYNCIGQDSLWLDNLLKMTQPDRHYCTINDTSKISKDSIFLEIIPPTYKEEEIILGSFLKEKDLQKPQIMIEVSPATLKYVIPKYRKKCYGKDFLKDIYTIQLMVVPAKYITIEVNQNDSSFKDLIITRKKVVQESTIKIISKSERLTTNYPTLAISKHISIRKELLLPSCCGLNFSILDIQEALVKAGYDCPTNDIIDSKTRQAIIQFQRDNNLPEGRLDIKTLKKLGVE